MFASRSQGMEDQTSDPKVRCDVQMACDALTTNVHAGKRETDEFVQLRSQVEPSAMMAALIN